MIKVIKIIQTDTEKNNEDPEYLQCQKIWISVLVRAIEDLKYKEIKEESIDAKSKSMQLMIRGNLQSKKRAKKWFLSSASEEYIGSYRWICMVLNLCPIQILRSMRKQGLLP